MALAKEDEERKGKEEEGCMGHFLEFVKGKVEASRRMRPTDVAGYPFGPSRFLTGIQLPDVQRARREAGSPRASEGPWA